MLHRHWRKCFELPRAAALLTAALLGQSPTIHTTVPLVTVPVSVTDRRGRPLNGLDAPDFVLLDNERLRQVRVDTLDSGLAPIALVNLIQTTATSLSALAKIRKVGAMISEAVVGANGEAAVITFADQIKVAQDFTTDAESISKTFNELKPQDSMAGRMIDATDTALQLLARRSGSRRASIMIIGESRDRGSKGKLSDLSRKFKTQERRCMA